MINRELGLESKFPMEELVVQQLLDLEYDHIHPNELFVKQELRVLGLRFPKEELVEQQLLDLLL